MSTQTKTKAARLPAKMTCRLLVSPICEGPSARTLSLSLCSCFAKLLTIPAERSSVCSQKSTGPKGVNSAYTHPGCRQSRHPLKGPIRRLWGTNPLVDLSINPLIDKGTWGLVPLEANQTKFA